MNPTMQRRLIITCRRRGFSLLEFQVALILLGVALTGLIPLMAIYSKAVKTLEKQLPLQGTRYVVPSADAWARKLGAAAQVTATAPAPRVAPPVLLVDDGDPACVETGGGWTTQTDPAAFQGHYCLHAAQSGAPDTVAWQFSGLPPGWYQITATWLPAPDRTATAAYAVSAGSVALGTFTVNQQQAPSGPQLSGARWQILLTARITDPNVQVRLSAQKDGSVAADGVQLVPLKNDVQVLSVVRSMSGEEVTAQVQVQVLVPQ
jgi:Tfp pilus assembly protein PilV